MESRARMSSTCTLERVSLGTDYMLPLNQTSSTLQYRRSGEECLAMGKSLGEQYCMEEDGPWVVNVFSQRNN